jgi:AraC-like DNA-binding protein
LSIRNLFLADRRRAWNALRRMLVKSWPGATTAQMDAFGPTWYAHAKSNFVLRGRGRGFAAPRRTSALSAKFAWGGEEAYTVAGRPLLADDDAWAVIGEGEVYDSRIAPARPVQTLAVFFDRAFVAEVRGARRATDEDALEGEVAAADPDEPLVLGRRRVAYDPTLARLVRESASAPPSDGVHEEILHVALDRVLSHAAGAPSEQARLPCVRAATRLEIHRRLCRAHDLLESAYAEPLTTARLARAAAMAPHHFLSRFREAFGATPHQLLVARRLERARWLLARTDLRVGDVARAVGLEGVGAFSARFHAATGLSPRAFRRKFGGSKKFGRGPGM